MLLPLKLEFDTVSFSLGTVVGFLLQTFITHYLARRRALEDRTARRLFEAVTKLRSVFHAELAVFSPELGACPKNIDAYLIERLPRLEAAVRDFEPFVGKGDIQAFTTAWKDFSRFCRQDITDQKCAAATVYPGPEPHPKEILRQHVERILSFAKS